MQTYVLYNIYVVNYIVNTAVAKGQTSSRSDLPSILHIFSLGIYNILFNCINLHKPDKS